MNAVAGRDRLLILACAVAAVLTGIFRYVPAGRVIPFLISTVALALLATLVGRAVEALGDRLGSGATGVLQSALGNLPELFVTLFALRAGLVGVVQAAIVGSILANTLFVLGLAFLIGGWKHGTQTFDAASARTTVLLLLLAVATLTIPSFTASIHSPAAGHELALSRLTAVLLLGLFALSLPSALARAEGEPAAGESTGKGLWPLGLAIGVLAAAGLGSAFVSDWFVHALEPAIGALHISQAFAGLVLVAIAGNAVENVVGIQLAARNQPDYALSVTLQSPLQIALVIAPAVVLLSPLVGGAAFTLAFPPLLIVALLLTVIVASVVVVDGESTWLEGVALIVLYVVIAAAFWWG